VGLAEHLRLVLEAGSHGFSGGSSHGGCGSGVGGWCPGWGRGEAREKVIFYCIRKTYGSMLETFTFVLYI